MENTALANGFYLAVVGDHDEAEPIRVQDGLWYSVGCADPHDLGSVEIIRAISVGIPPRKHREEERRWMKLREENYTKYRADFKRAFGRDPGHRRWAAPAPSLNEQGAEPCPACLGEAEGCGVCNERGAA